MKKTGSEVKKLFLTAIVVFGIFPLYAQTSRDTVKSGRSNDPMNVNPGKVDDGMAVKPADPHDGMSVLSDTGFLSKNIMDNRMEIELSKLAQQKATDVTIKKLAGLMVTDHSAILNQLERLPAAKKGTSTGEQKESAMDLPNLPGGKGFDLAWAAQMLTMHEAKIVELERFIGMTKDPALKAVVMKAIPKIKAHRDALAKIPGAKDKSGSSQTI